MMFICTFFQKMAPAVKEKITGYTSQAKKKCFFYVRNYLLSHQNHVSKDLASNLNCSVNIYDKAYRFSSSCFRRTNNKISDFKTNNNCLQTDIL